MFFEKDEEIISAIGKLKNCTKLYLDTEIADWKSKTDAKISLIQALPESKDTNTSDVDKLRKNVVILDVLKKDKLIALFIEEIMKNEKIEKVFHNASFDLRYLGGHDAKNVSCTLKKARAIPKDLLKSENLKLSGLIHHFYESITPEKGEQSSDWGKRPLTEGQVKYAYLDPVYALLLDVKLDAFKKDHSKEIDELVEKLKKTRLEAPKKEVLKKEPKVKVELKPKKEKVVKAPVEKKEKKPRPERISYSVSVQSLVQTLVDNKVQDLNFQLFLPKTLIDELAARKIVLKDLKSEPFVRKPRAPKKKEEDVKK